VEQDENLGIVGVPAEFRPGTTRIQVEVLLPNPADSLYVHFSKYWHPRRPVVNKSSD